VAEGSPDEDAVVTTQTVNLPDSVQAQIRLGELVYRNGAREYQPNLMVPRADRTDEQDAALRAALRLARTGRFPPPPRARRAERPRTLRGPTDDASPYPSAPYRVLAAFRIWAVISYFFPYRDLMGENWDEILRQFIPRMESAKNALEYHLAVAEMVTHIHDTHGAVVSPVLVKHFGEASAPIRVRMIEDVPVVTGFTNADVATAAGFEIGDVILKVDGQDASARIAERLKYVAHSTPQAGMFYAAERSLVRGPPDSTAIYTIRDVHDRVRDVAVARKTEYGLKTVGDRSGDVLRILPGNIGYADLDRLPQARVDEMFEKFKDCPGIIFDDRGYPQGTAWQITPRLTDKTDVAGAMFKLRESMSPDLPNGEILSSQVVKTFVQRLPATDKWRYHGRTVLLIDERSVSQAEHSGLFFETANDTKFIGSPTEGADGDVTSFSVPGGISVHFSGQGVWHIDGRQLQRMGLQPDVAVRPTLAGIRAGRDEVLDKAVEYLSHAR
jgi:C-terminal processing protease CtpA/Prc